MSLSSPPNPDEFEVSIIGPGRGECIVLHLGNNEWCVVDSCIARGSREPVAVEYLRRFENALDRVKLIIATHWHDDHIRGIASVLTHCPNAQFSCSMALQNENFARLVAVSTEAIQGRSGLDEFSSVLDLLQQRRATSVPRNLVSPQWAIVNRTLLSLPADNRPSQARITAISPSDGVVKLALTQFAQWLPKVGQPQRRIVNPAPNRTSVALWIEVGDRRALLGADLEHTRNAGEGWLAVLTSCPNLAPAAIFKIPHHGSVNADCAEVWPGMLIGDPIAVVTPFNGGVRLPTAADLKRLTARTQKLYCTSPVPGHPPRRDSSVEKTMKLFVKDRRVIEGLSGQVRIRWSLSSAAALPSVETFNGADQIAAA